MDLVPGSLTGAWTIGPPCLVFVACAYFTRAPVARVLAALVSGAAVAGFNIAADVLAHHRGWWRYPGVGDRGFGPLVWYAGAGIGVSGLSLIAWRAHRRWGLTGTIVFLLALAAYGSTRDWTVSHVMRDLIVFGGGAVPWIADYVAWLVCGASVAIAVQALLPRAARPGCAPSTANPSRAEARPLTRRRDDILAFFDHHASNGPTEAINGRLEALRRNALGFRNLTHYRWRSLLHSGALHALVNAL